MHPLNVTLVQGNTRWHDADGNRAYYGGLMQRLAGKTDLVVLPETFTSGFSNTAIEHAETMQGATIDWMRERAHALDAAITGSVQMRIKEEGEEEVYNRMLFVTPDGGLQHYDKRHLFRYASEHEHYAPGSRRQVVQWRDWRILLQVCYDLRFPVFSRNWHDETAAGGMDYDLMLYIANWPTPRRTAWRTLLRSRAIENLSFCAGVNRVGVDGNDHPYSGDSAVLDPLGAALVDLGAREQVVTVTLDAQQLLDHRQHFPAWMDADSFKIDN